MKKLYCFVPTTKAGSGVIRKFLHQNQTILKQYGYVYQRDYMVDDLDNIKNHILVEEDTDGILYGSVDI